MATATAQKDNVILRVRSAFDNAITDYRGAYTNYVQALHEKDVDDDHYRAYLDWRTDVLNRELQLRKDGIPDKTLQDIRSEVCEAWQKANELKYDESISRDKDTVSCDLAMFDDNKNVVMVLDKAR